MRNEEEPEYHEGVELVIVEPSEHPSSPPTLKPTKTNLYKDAFLIIIILVLIILWVLFSRFQKSAPSQRPLLTPVPTIGVLSKPLWEEQYDIVTKKTQVIEAKYARWVESGGGKPVFINYNSTESELRKIFGQINGLMLIGGATELIEYDSALQKPKLTLYGQKAKFMIDLAKEAFAAGVYFPVWGTCLGYEIMLLSIAEDYSLLRGNCDCFQYNGALNFTESANSSRLYSEFSKEQITNLTENPIAYNSHNYFVTVEDFYRNPKLVADIKVLSTSSNKNGTLQFISSVEGIKYPFYAVQFHPEKNGYDFNPTNPSIHSPEAIKAMQTYPVFFVNEARKNDHAFASPEEEAKNSVYNGEIAFDSNLGAVYLFP